MLSSKAGNFTLQPTAQFRYSEIAQTQAGTQAMAWGWQCKTFVQLKVTDILKLPWFYRLCPRNKLFLAKATSLHSKDK